MTLSYPKLGLFGIILILSVSIGDAHSQEGEFEMKGEITVTGDLKQAKDGEDENPYASIEENLLSIIAIITAASTAFGLIFSQIFSGLQMKDEKDTKFLAQAEKYSKTITDNFEAGFSIGQNNEVDGSDSSEGTGSGEGSGGSKGKNNNQMKTEEDLKEECVDWAFKYIDFLDMLAYIKKKKAIPKKLTDYFGDGWFGIAKTLMAWHDVAVRQDKQFINMDWFEKIETDDEDKDKQKEFVKNLFDKIQRNVQGEDDYDIKVRNFRSAKDTWPTVYAHCFNVKNNIDCVPLEELPDILIEKYFITNDVIKQFSLDKAFYR